MPLFLFTIKGWFTDPWLAWSFSTSPFTKLNRKVTIVWWGSLRLIILATVLTHLRAESQNKSHHIIPLWFIEGVKDHDNCFCKKLKIKLCRNFLNLNILQPLFFWRSDAKKRCQFISVSLVDGWGTSWFEVAKLWNFMERVRSFSYLRIDRLWSHFG